MTGYRSFKRGLYAVSKSSGFTGALRDSAWRSRKLLILAYHGVSFEDEHEWDPSLFMSRELLRERFLALRQWKCNVLGLSEALDRLYAGTLPPRSVAITFDDGTADFYARAHPLIREFGYPVTVYWTSYYATFQKPVPNVAFSYLLWQARGQSLEWPEFLSTAVTLDAPGRQAARARILKSMQDRGFDAQQKDSALAELAERLRLDYGAFCRKRILQIMNPDEASSLVRAGVDLQIHTHRHRTPPDRNLLLREFADNRQAIVGVGAPCPRHFCYPSGNYRHLNLDWLATADIESAVTCDPGLATRRNHRLLLPRFVDTSSCSPQEFEAWVCGVAQLLPRGKAQQRLS
jgi:peptidoglycan/xylan/chitin deacetylase (PgdA/CDA1 family)